jgi:hypothetical protein
LKGVNHENQDFLGPEMAASDASAIWALKSLELLFSVGKSLFKPTTI